MIRTLICAVSALACLPTAFASTCEDQKLVDLPDDGGTPVAWITPDFEIQALGPSGSGATSRRDPIHDLTIQRTMDSANYDLYLTLNGLGGAGCAPFSPSGVPVPLGSIRKIRILVTIDGHPHEADGEVVVVDTDGNVLGKLPASETFAPHFGSVLIIDPAVKPDADVCSVDRMIWNQVRGEASVNFNTCE